MLDTSTARRACLTFDSVRELADTVMGCTEAVTATNGYMRVMRSFYGGDVASLAEVVRLAKEGLSADGVEAMRIAEHNVNVMDAELPLPSFTTFYDVAGSNVDVGRYLAGEPECMINFQMVEAPRQGRIITLVVSIGALAGVRADDMRERGREIVSLILAIERIGFQVELWADSLARSKRQRGVTGRVRVKVKAPGDILDTGNLMFAFTHPAMFRALVLSSRHLFPPAIQKAMDIGNSYGSTVHEPDIREYPEGAILIPPIQANRGPTDIVTETLKELGII